MDSSSYRWLNSHAAGEDWAASGVGGRFEMKSLGRAHTITLVVLALTIFAIVALAWIGSRQGQQIDQSDEGETHQYSYNAEDTDKQYGPAEGHWRPEFAARDTYAQWIMAIFSAIATAFSGWAVWLLRGTLIETRKAVNAADNSVEVAREIGRKQVRAYLSCTGAQFGADAKWLQCEIFFANKGQSPAHRIEVTGSVAITVRDRDTGRLTRHDSRPNTSFSEIIPAGGDGHTYLIWSRRELGDAGLDAILSGDGTFSIDGEVSWSDIFNDVQTASFSIFVDTGPRDTFSPDLYRVTGKMRANNKRIGERQA